MSYTDLCNTRLIMIFVIVSVVVFQQGVDFQMMMYMYHPPKHFCQTPNLTDVTVDEDNCHYYIKKGFSITRHECQVWKYDRSQIESTVVTELSLVCQHKYLQLLIMPIRTICTIFNILLAFFSDIKGRRLLLLITIYLDTILWILLALSPINYVVHLIIRSVKTFGSASSMIGFVLVSELTPTKYRNLVSINYWIPFSLGMAVAPMYMWTTRNWRSAYLISAIPNIVCVLAPFVILESPQWLLTNNKKEEAMVIYQKLDNTSYHEETENIVEETKEEQNNDFCKELWSFLSSCTLISRLSVLCFSSFTIFFVYQGISTNLTFASSNIYISTIVLGLIEIPSGPLSYLSSVYIGSVYTTAIGLCLTVIFYTIGTVLASSSLQSSAAGNICKLVLACLVKLMITASWNIQGVFYINLIPTSLRNFITNFGEIFGIVGAALGAFIGYYLASKFIVASIIYDSMLFISMLLIGFIIPPLQDRNLPQTVTEAKAIKKNFL